MNNLKRKNIKISIIISILAASLLSLLFLGKYLRLEKIYQVFNKLNSLELKSDNNEYNMCVHFLDVGKADCIYIKCEDKHILIDAANKDVSSGVVEYLCRQNVDKLDLVIATHPHSDHIGQMHDVINSFEIDNFVMSEIPQKIIPTFTTYKKMLKSIQDKQLKIKLVHAGEKFTLGNLKINILSPCRQYDNLNNNSVVMRLEYGNDSFIFMGDAEKEAENDMVKSNLNLDSTVLKVGHHGSSTSTTKDFLEKVAPEFSIISVGKNIHKLPKKNIIKRIKKTGSKVYRTDTHGTIILRTNGKGIDVLTERRIA
ncbi:MAG: MBL fold metallo-hydrolase [Oscillospiraceae bacterium]|jgi:competence protein ComEC|nr:MBL fold metallo-hydrolase [Oscillospiraceae bacterium]